MHSKIYLKRLVNVILLSLITYERMFVAWKLTKWIPTCLYLCASQLIQFLLRLQLCESTIKLFLSYILTNNPLTSSQNYEHQHSVTYFPCDKKKDKNKQKFDFPFCNASPNVTYVSFTPQLIRPDWSWGSSPTSGSKKATTFKPINTKRMPLSYQ